MPGTDRNRLAQVALRATDLDRAIAFYRDVLEVPFVARFDPPGLAFFDLGGTRLLLEGAAPPSLLYWRVDHIEPACEALRAKGVTIVEEPRLIFRDEAGQFGAPGTEVWMASFRDSEDNLVVLDEDRAPPVTDASADH
jgi:methylmalonyl-CoA/ethylmalonyl-CoA epimerase